MKKEAEIYIHIPLCIKKCEYCDFLSGKADEETRREYTRLLREEIRTSSWVAEGISVPTIFIGGGTPSILNGAQVRDILQTVKESFQVQENAEITIEANPGTLSEEKLNAYKEAGINRLSIGLQTTNMEELKLLGRIHTYDDFLESYRLARKAGFTNINVDIMSALPGQSIASYKETLKRVCSLKPEHIYAYSLIIEEGTPFAARYMEDEYRREKGEKPELLPSEEEERQMYELTKEFLETQGYRRYEISNYAKPSYECKHNIGYWTRKDYLGFGLGASSLYQDIRYRNQEDLCRYLNLDWKREEQLLSEKEKIEEFMFLGLRLDKGVSKQEFKENFLEDIEIVYGEVIDVLKKQALITEEGGRIYLTSFGRDVSTFVMSHFLFS